MTFVHWPADPRLVAPFLPRGVDPDILDGTTYIGLIALRMERVGPPGLPGLPYLGSFPEINIRLYSVGPDGRRGVVFRTMEASRLVPVLAARLGVRLPYQWAKMRAGRHGRVAAYTSKRRWPDRSRPGVRLRIRVGEQIAQPSALENFVTARWGLHATWYTGNTFYLPNEHPRWPLYRAQLLDLDEHLVRAVGLPGPEQPPVSVLYSPGVPVRFGVPRLLTAPGGIAT